MRRLNRIEYQNTVRDLLGSTLALAEEFPQDDLYYGFDNVGSALIFSPLHMELYERAADRLVEELFARAADDPWRQRILTCDYSADPACTELILEALASRAWRRPSTDAELTPYLTLATTKATEWGSVEHGLRLAIKALLMSPNFLFRVENDPAAAPETPHPLDAYEVATRLSYFLWSTMPDSELFDAAAAGSLLAQADVTAQARRMLADTKASEFISNFAGQWLQLRLVDTLTRDYELFPDFNAELQADLRRETSLFFEKFLNEPLPVSQLLTAEFSFLNSRLAEHYGVDATGLTADEFTQVSLAGTQRGGLLRQGSFLTITSHPNKTSPVRRGKWVLEQLLCSAPPPPPPGVDVDIEPPEGEAQTLRQALELHRADPACAGCHSVMDPIGLGLENYDAVGSYRTMEAGLMIDASGELPGGIVFTGAAELSQVLALDQRFGPCMTKQLLTYALGRGIDPVVDQPWIDSVSTAAASQGYTLQAILEAVVTSPVFLSRRAPVEAP